jgi:hypothetical protein
MEKMMQAILAIDDDYEISICPMLRASGLYYEVEIYKWSQKHGKTESDSVVSAVEPTIKEGIAKIYNVLKDKGKVS